MVKLANVRISTQGIDAEIDSAERKERARGGVIDSNFRSRVRGEIIQGRRLDEVSRVRAGRDKKSPGQINAEKQLAADRAARAARGNISREDLRRQGRLAGSRGVQGITRSPSRISGNTIGPDSRGGVATFRSTPERTFESREQQIQRQVKERIRPKIAASLGAKIDRRAEQRLRAVTQVRNQRTLVLTERPDVVGPRILNVKTRVAGPADVLAAIDAGPGRAAKDRPTPLNVTKPFNVTGVGPTISEAGERLQFQAERDQGTFGGVTKGVASIPIIRVGGILSFAEESVKEGGVLGPGIGAISLVTKSGIAFSKDPFGAGAVGGQVARSRPATAASFLPSSIIALPIPRTFKVPTVSKRPIKVSTSDLTFKTVSARRESGRVFAVTSKAQAGDRVATAEARGVQRSLNLRGGASQQQSRIEIRTTNPRGRVRESRVRQSGRQTKVGDGATLGVISGRDKAGGRLGVPFVTQFATKDLATVGGLDRVLVGGRTFKRRLGGAIKPKEVSNVLAISTEELKISRGGVDVTEGTVRFAGFSPQSKNLGIGVKGGGPTRVQSILTRGSNLLPKGRKGAVSTSLSVPKRPLSKGTSAPKRPARLQSGFDIAAAEASRRAAVKALGVRDRFRVGSRRVTVPKTKIFTGVSIGSRAGKITPQTTPLLGVLQGGKIIRGPDTSQIPGIRADTGPGTRAIQNPIQGPDTIISLTPRTITELTTRQITTPTRPTLVPIVPFTVPKLFPNRTPVGGFGGGFLPAGGRGRRGGARARRPSRRFASSQIGIQAAEFGNILSQSQGTGLAGFGIRGEGPGVKFPKQKRKKKSKRKKKKKKAKPKKKKKKSKKRRKN